MLQKHIILNYLTCGLEMIRADRNNSQSRMQLYTFTGTIGEKSFISISAGYYKTAVNNFNANLLTEPWQRGIFFSLCAHPSSPSSPNTKGHGQNIHFPIGGPKTTCPEFPWIATGTLSFQVCVHGMWCVCILCGCVHVGKEAERKNSLPPHSSHCTGCCQGQHHCSSQDKK